MKNTKNKKKYILMSSAFLSIVSVLPIATLTGCSSISQFFVPVVVQHSPFSKTTSPIIDPYLSKGITSDSKTSTSSYQNLLDFMPQSYAFTLKSSDTSNNSIESALSYTYATKPTFDKNVKDTPFIFNESDLYSRRWLSSSDEKMGFTSQDGKITSYENLCVSAATIGINSLSYNFLTLLDYLDRYQTRIINNTDDQMVNTYLSAMYTNSDTSETSGFIHGEKKSQENKDFYEYCYDKANLLSTGNTHYKFGVYDIEFDITKSGVYTGLEDLLGENDTPFIQLTNIDLRSPEYGYDVNSDENKDIPYLIPTNEYFVGTYKWEGNDKDGKYIWTKPSKSSPYLTYTYAKDDKKHETPIDVASITTIPTLIQLNTAHNAYYDPTQKLSSIYPSDWLTPSNSLSKVNDSVKESKAWKNITKHTDSDPAITSLNYTVSFPKSNYTGDYSTWWNDSLKTNKKIDPSINKWTSDANHEIQPGQFIALANYALKEVTYKYKKTDGSYGHFKTKIPYFSGFGSLFPAYFAFLSEGMYKLIDNAENSVDNNRYIFDFDKDKIEGKKVDNLYDVFAKLIKNLCSSDLKPSVNKYTTNNQAFNEDKLFLYWWLFGQNNKGDYTNGGLIKSSDILIKK